MALAQEVKSQNKDQTTTRKRALQKEKEMASRLATSSHQGNVAEEGFRGEINQWVISDAPLSVIEKRITGSLTKSGSWRHEISSQRVKRSDSQFTELLGHNNSAQRIVYLDWVRRELADTKQMPVAATRERDVAGARIERLRRELRLYLSVRAEGSYESRTTMTPVGRIPLVTQNENVKAGCRTVVAQSSWGFRRRSRIG
ncbi:hypothetical protein BC826DRAFT_966034 [Russula brevipes]|nr:hypothetical protein BC826DRAFT_966034 [Russula brevipes]